MKGRKPFVPTKYRPSVYKGGMPEKASATLFQQYCRLGGSRKLVVWYLQAIQGWRSPRSTHASIAWIGPFLQESDRDLDFILVQRDRGLADGQIDLVLDMGWSAPSADQLIPRRVQRSIRRKGQRC